MSVVWPTAESDAFQTCLYEFTVPVTNLSVTDVILHGIDEFHVVNRTPNLLHKSGDSFISVCSPAGWPSGCEARADLSLPLRVCGREVIGPCVAGSAAVGSVDYDDVESGKANPTICSLKNRLIPLRDLPEKNAG